MTKNSILGGLCALCALAACSATSPHPASTTATGIDQHILDAARRIEQAQAQLNRAGAFDAPVPAAAGTLTDGQMVSVSWKGDAEQLLAGLAQARGLVFSTEGVRMPLPVTVDARDETLESVLARLRAQIGYRAAIGQQAGQLVLHYNPPRP